MPDKTNNAASQENRTSQSTVSNAEGDPQGAIPLLYFDQSTSWYNPSAKSELFQCCYNSLM